MKFLYISLIILTLNIINKTFGSENQKPEKLKNIKKEICNLQQFPEKVQKINVEYCANSGNDSAITSATNHLQKIDDKIELHNQSTCRLHCGIMHAWLLNQIEIIDIEPHTIVDLRKFVNKFDYQDRGSLRLLILTPYTFKKRWEIELTRHSSFLKCILVSDSVMMNGVYIGWHLATIS